MVPFLTSIPRRVLLPMLLAAGALCAGGAQAGGVQWSVGIQLPAPPVVLLPRPAATCLRASAGICATGAAGHLRRARTPLAASPPPPPLARRRPLGSGRRQSLERRTRRLALRALISRRSDRCTRQSRCPRRPPQSSARVAPLDPHRPGRFAAPHSAA